MRKVIFEYCLNLHIFYYEWYGEVAWKLRACTTPAEDQSRFPEPISGGPQLPATPAPGHLRARSFFDACRSYAHT